MARVVILTILSLVITVGNCLGAAPAIEWESQKILSLEAAPLDLATTADGSKVFVLLEGGKLLICTSDGEIRNRFDVAPQADRIEVAPGGDKVYIASARSKTFQVIQVDSVFDINTSGSPFRGPAEAPVEIVVFSDFQCPYCARLVPLLEQVCTLYPKDVKLVFKNFPLRNHAFSRQAASAALAANEQGKFWPFHDKLFASYTQLNEAKILDIAKELGLDPDKFEMDIKSRKILAQINQDVQDARTVGVRGTPTVLINGKKLREGSLQGFQTQIEKALQQGKKRDKSSLKK